MSAATLLGLINEAIGYSASFHYCGSINFDDVATQIKTNFVLAENGIASLSYQETKPINKTIIYLVNDKKARQNQVYFSILGDAYKSSEDGYLQLLAQYIGGSFSGLILQEIREYRSLAYTAGGRFTKPVKEGKPLLFTSFVGCQADKTNESIDVMLGLINDLPKYPDRIKTFKTFLLSTVSTRYPQQRELSEKIEELKLKGFASDPLMGEFNSVKNSNFETVYSFYERNIKGKPLLITIYGDKSKIDMEKLKTYGEIIEIKKDDIATY